MSMLYEDRVGTKQNMGRTERSMNLLFGQRVGSSHIQGLNEARSHVLMSEGPLGDLCKGLSPVVLSREDIISALAYELRHDLRSDDGLMRAHAYRCCISCACKGETCSLQAFPQALPFLHVKDTISNPQDRNTFLEIFRSMCKCYWDHIPGRSSYVYLERLLSAINQLPGDAPFSTPAAERPSSTMGSAKNASTRRSKKERRNGASYVSPKRKTSKTTKKNKYNIY